MSKNPNSATAAFSNPLTILALGAVLVGFLAFKGGK
jgi:hypothetical protein